MLPKPRGCGPWAEHKEASIPLKDLPLLPNPHTLPGDVRAFLEEADRRIERFQQERHIPGFVASDFVAVYGALKYLASSDLAPGSLFCEWGSGFGVVTCLAALLDFDACGIEIEGELVAAAEQLAEDFEMPVEFFHDSFIPAGSPVRLDHENTFSWLTTERSHHQAEDRLGPGDYDVIFAYPWPDEEGIIETLFERHAAPGAVLATYHSFGDIRLQRKIARNDRGRR